MSAELQFLAYCVRSVMNDHADDAALSAPRSLDWDRLLRLARGHRCSPLLHSALARTQNHSIPEAFRRPLSSDAMADVARCAFLQQRLCEVLTMFESGAVRCIILKGPGVGALAYPDPMLRPFDDLDILVHPDDFLRAQGVLQEAGFTPLVRLDSREARDQMRLGWDRGFRSPAGDYCVELCQGIAPSYFGFALPTAELWRSVQRVRLSECTVHVPDNEALLLLLCAHGTKHLWSRLIWIADVSGLVRRSGEGFDWHRLGRRAERLGGRRMLALGLALAGELNATNAVGDCGSLFASCAPRCGATGATGLGQPFRLKLSDGARTGLSSDDEGRTVEALVRETVVRLDALSWPAPSRRVEIRYHLRARERWRDCLGYVCRWSLTPSFGDWRWVRIPQGWRWLYYVVRPLRLGGRVLKQVVKG